MFKYGGVCSGQDSHCSSARVTTAKVDFVLRLFGNGLINWKICSVLSGMTSTYNTVGGIEENLAGQAVLKHFLKSGLREVFADVKNISGFKDNKGSTDKLLFYFNFGASLKWEPKASRKSSKFPLHGQASRVLEMYTHRELQKNVYFETEMRKCKVRIGGMYIEMESLSS